MLCDHNFWVALATPEDQEEDDIYDGPESEGTQAKITELHYVAAPRTCPTAQDLVDFLWDYDDGHHRKRWENYPYWALCRQAYQITQAQYGKEVADSFHDTVKRYFLLTSFIIPFANNERFWPTLNGKRKSV